MLCARRPFPPQRVAIGFVSAQMNSHADGRWSRDSLNRNFISKLVEWKQIENYLVDMVGFRFIRVLHSAFGRQIFDFYGERLLLSTSLDSYINYSKLESKVQRKTFRLFSSRSHRTIKLTQCSRPYSKLSIILSEIKLPTFHVSLPLNSN